MTLMLTPNGLQVQPQQYPDTPFQQLIERNQIGFMLEGGCGTLQHLSSNYHQGTPANHIV